MSSPVWPETLFLLLTYEMVGTHLCSIETMIAGWKASSNCRLFRSQEKILTWNAKCPIFVQATFPLKHPKTSNYCLKNRALGFPGSTSLQKNPYLNQLHLPCKLLQLPLHAMAVFATRSPTKKLAVWQGGLKRRKKNNINFYLWSAVHAHQKSKIHLTW